MRVAALLQLPVSVAAHLAPPRTAGARIAAHPPSVPFGGAKPFGSVTRNLELKTLGACLYEITTQAGILPKSRPLDGGAEPSARSARSSEAEARVEQGAEGSD